MLYNLVTGIVYDVKSCVFFNILMACLAVSCGLIGEKKRTLPIFQQNISGKRIKAFIFLYLSPFNLAFRTTGISLGPLCLNTWGNG